MIQLSMDREHYDGLWRKDGTWAPDPPDAELVQYRMNAGFGYRLGERWQGSVVLPYVWNNNHYSGLTSDTSDLGDTTLSLLYESFENATCVYRVTEWRDLLPAAYWGATLTVPTGVSPYDSVRDNFDITGRGYYRLDANVLVEKTVYPWTASLQLSYGRHLARPVNREYGTYVEPYDKQIGDRASASFGGGYVFFTPMLDEITATVAYSELWEGKAKIDGAPDENSGFRKRALAATLAWANPKKDWVTKLTWSHAIRGDDWGYNFPTTDVVTMGVSHVFE